MNAKKPTSQYSWAKCLLAWCEATSQPCRVKVFAGVVALLCMLFIVSFLQVIAQPHTKGVAVIDLARIQTTFLKQVSHQSLSKPEMKTLSHRFAEALERATHRVAKQHQGVLFVKGAIVNGGVDVTQAVEREVSIIMRNTTNKALSQRVQKLRRDK